MNVTIDRNGTKYGPYTLEEIKEYLGNGTLNENDLASNEGSTDWFCLKEIMTLADPPPSLPEPKLQPFIPLAVPPVNTNPIDNASEVLKSRLEAIAGKSDSKMSWKNLRLFRQFVFYMTIGIQFIAWLICFGVVVLNGLDFLGELAHAEGAPEQAAAGAMTCTYFIGAYVFARLVEKIS